jgi:predicted site-specific integrase-resolvase
MVTDDLLTVDEAAEILGVQKQRLYVLRCDGKGPLSFRRGNRLVYPKSGLDQYLAEERKSTTRGGY